MGTKKRKTPLTKKEDPEHVIISILLSIGRIRGLISPFECYVKNIVPKIIDAEHRIQVYKNISPIFLVIIIQIYT